MSQVSFDDTMEKLAELEQFAENYAGNTQGADAKALASCYLFSDRFFADSKEELEQAVFSGYRTHWLTQELLTAFELDASEDQSSLKLASDTMADYLYAHAKLPETGQIETKKEELFEDTEFPYWSEDTAGMVVTDETGQVSGAGLAGIAVLLLVAVFLFIAWNRKK